MESALTVLAFAAVPVFTVAVLGFAVWLVVNTETPRRG
jgi:hypothetical protein